jgi:hypothetical protein
MKEKHAPKSGYGFFTWISPVRERRAIYIILLDLLVVYLAIIKLSHNPCSSLPFPFGATLILIRTIQSPV